MEHAKQQHVVAMLRPIMSWAEILSSSAFTTEARSYGQALGKTVNLGVISVVFFKERVPTLMRETWNDDRGRRMPAPSSSAPRELESASAAAKRADDEFAATGMGRRTDHAVTQVWLDLEDAPAQTVNIRYEFRP